MKKIIALLPNDCAERSRIALEKRGIRSVIVVPVQEKIRYDHMVFDPESLLYHRDSSFLQLNPECDRKNSSPPKGMNYFVREPGPEFFPRTMFIIFVRDEDVHHAVHELMDVNRNDDHEEGKIFVCPMVSVIDIENDEYEYNLSS